MMGYGSGMGGGLFFGLLLIAGLVLLGLVLVRVMGGGLGRRTGGGGADGPGPNSPGASARRLLDERYARGELSTEEYQERLRVLRQSD